MRPWAAAFLICLGGELLTAWFLNHRVMTEHVFLAMLEMDAGDPRADAALGAVRLWRRLSYVMTPPLLLARIGVAALVVQLLLIGVRSRSRLRPIFVASLWAQVVLVVERAIRTLRLSLLPPGVRDASGIPEPLVAIGQVLPVPDPLGQASMFAVLWCVVFISVLTDGERLRRSAVVMSVVGAALVFGCVRWAGWVYLTRFEQLSQGP